MGWGAGLMMLWRGFFSPCFIVSPTAFILVLGTAQGIKKTFVDSGIDWFWGLEYICKYPLRILHPIGIKHLMFYSVLSQYANVQVPWWHIDNIITHTHSHLHTKEMTAHIEDTIRGRLCLRNLLGFNARMIECVPRCWWPASAGETSLQAPWNKKYLS